MQMNPWRYATPPGWLPIESAPRDGTVIEIQNNWGVAPWFRLHRWVDQRGWVDADDDSRSLGSEDGLHLSWRPYTKTDRPYVDPTGGASRTVGYWRAAEGLPPSLDDDVLLEDWGAVRRARMEAAAPAEPKASPGHEPNRTYDDGLKALAIGLACGVVGFCVALVVFNVL